MAPPRAVDNFGQRQPITTAIKTICLYYPPNTCLRELLQNADDAGATEIEYVLDTKTYNDKPLLSDGLEDYQGPALLARNNSEFRDQDFESLSSVGDSVKRHDPASTGKFGQGFNAVYHWTDGPWVYSRNWLLILDPHEWWSRETGQPGGPRWDVIQNRNSIEIQNHLKTFNAFDLDTSQELNQTVIRIPLRSAAQAAKSKLFGLKVDLKEITIALREFSQELQEGALLYLKHIRKVVIRINNEVILKAEILETIKEDMMTREQLSTDFKSLYVSKPPAITEDIFPIFELAIKYTEQTSSRIDRYVVQHAMLKSSGDWKLDIWASERKLFPWVAIAAHLEDESKEISSRGRLFTTLRLPMATSLPVHIHGLFCISPDRGRLDFTRGSNDLPTKWNSFLFTRCVALAWVKLLVYRNNVSWRREMFGFWPRPNFVPVESVALWEELDDHVIDNAINLKRVVWNSSDGRCVDIEDGFFAIKDAEATKYRKALAQVRISAVYLDEALFRKVQQRAKLLGKTQKILGPGTVRQFLRWQKLPTLSERDASLVLEFCLLDAIKSQSEDSSRSGLYDDFQGIELWPTINGALSISNNVDLLLPRDNAEMQLFAQARAKNTLDLFKVSPPVQKLLFKDINHLASVMRYRRLGDLNVDWPVMYPMEPLHGVSPEFAPRPSDLDNTLGSIWVWISERIREGQRIDPSLSGELWLIPVSSGRIRRYKAYEESVPVLILEQNDTLFKILRAATSQDPAKSPPVLNIETLSAGAVGLLRNDKDIRTNTNCTCVDYADTFVDWLVAGKQMLLATSDQDKAALLGHLEFLTRESKLPGGLSTTLLTQTRRLPLYSKISCWHPFKEVGRIKSSLDLEGILYETPSGLPPLPKISGVSFFDPQGLVENALVKRLKVLKKMLPKDLLTHHFLPWMDSIPTTCADDSSIAKEGLIDWILKKAPPTCSPVWQTDVFSHSIIPVSSQDGQRRYRCLAGMVDPSSDIAQLYDEEEGVFPRPDFFERNKGTLLAYGLLSKPTWSTPIARARYFSRHHNVIDNNRIEALLKLPVPVELSLSKSSIAEIRRLKFLPATSITGDAVILAPNECRGADEGYLVDLVWGTTAFPVKAAWKILLGWNDKIGTEVLLQQLDGCLYAEQFEKANKVLAQIDHNNCSALLSRPCILGRSGEYFTPDKCFFPGSSLVSRPLAPYLDVVDANFARQHEGLLAALGVQSEPSIQDLRNVQDWLMAVNDDQLDPTGVAIAISTLETATRLFYDPTDLLVPDTTSRLRGLGDIVHGDPLRTGDTDFNFTHPEVSADLTRRLHIEDSLKRAIRLNIDVDSDDEDDYTPKESLEVKIADTLERYPIATTFNEFLANADDAKATKIVWTLDECKPGAHASSSLLTTELKTFQGPALLVYNDRVFSRNDFSGLKNIGRGGKEDDPTSTGAFGMGALSMYHFTDVPMLVSANSFLVLDPQQQVLPVDYNNRRKRRVGTKMSLSAVKRMAPDQLSPFSGLHGFDGCADQYEGTIFRFPLRAVGTRTALKDSTSKLDVAEVISLLEGYFHTARTSLLFLRHIETIEFRIRGQREPRWTISTKRGQYVDNTFRPIEIASHQLGSEVQVDAWSTSLRIVDKIPPNIVRSGRSSKKSVECGIAACLFQGGRFSLEHNDGASTNTSTGAELDLTRRPIVKHNVFCRLHTGHESSLPISVHASFAVTGDRRSIVLEKGVENADCNQWLLKSCISTLYVETLQYLAPRLGQKVFDLWPSGGYQDTLSEMLSKAFWDKVGARDQVFGNLLPPMTQDTPIDIENYATVVEPTQKTTTLAEARFEFLPESTSETLRVLLLQTVPLLVCPPRRLWLDFKTSLGSNIKKIDSACLSQTFKVEANCRLLEAFVTGLKSDEDRIRAMTLLLESIIPANSRTDDSRPALSALNGCRIMPRPHFNCPLGTLIWSPQPGMIWNLLPTSEEQELFSFAADRLIGNQLLTKPISGSALVKGNIFDIFQALLKADFNFRRMGLDDAGDLLALPQSPMKSFQKDDFASWIFKFWQYLNPRLRTMYSKEDYSKNSAEVTSGKLLSKANLQDHAIYRTFSELRWRYITPRQFEVLPCVIKPKNEHHQRICDQIHGLTVIDRDCVPFLLQEKEDSFNEYASFRRLLEAFEKLEKIAKVSAKTLLGDSLNFELKEVMKDLSLKYLRSEDYNSTSMDAVIRRVPIWPRKEPSTTSLHKHIAAEDAVFCGHEQILMPWVKNLSTYVEPKLVEFHGKELSKLGVDLLTREQVWHNIKGDIPNDIKPIESRRKHLELIRYFARWEMKPSGKLAPNGGSIMCETNTLYDHQDEMFSAAFREQKTTRFLHADMQDRELRSFWQSLGLRSRPSTRIMKYEYYLECVLAMNRRWDPAFTSPHYSLDSEVISAYLNYDRPEFRSWPNNVWAQISTIPIFTVRDVHADEITYRRARMDQIAREKTHCTLRDSTNLAHKRLMWSQSRFLKNPPGSFVYNALPEGGAPTAAQVFEHLKFLIGLIPDVTQDDLPEFLRDVQACYEHLQANLEATKHIPGVRQPRVWLNLDTTQVDLVFKDNLEPSKTAANRLCVNCPVDPLPIKVARKFLVPYEKLLVGLGCKTVLQPKSAAPPPSSDSRERSLAESMSAMVKLRDCGLLVDITFEAGGQRKPAHRVVLAAVSEYCKAQFAGPWGNLLEHQATVHLVDVTFFTLSQMVDFAYTGDIDWPELKDSGDNEEISTNLGQLLDLLDGTDMWLLRRLHSMTEYFLTSQPYSGIYVRVDTVEEVKERAESARAHRLVKYCEGFWADNEEFVVAMRDDK